MVPGAMADLVLLHGFTQTGRSWQPIGHALAGRYRAAAPDLPGLAVDDPGPASGHAAGRALPDVSEALTAVLGAAGLAWRQFLPALTLSNLGIAAVYAVFGHLARSEGQLLAALVASIVLPSVRCMRASSTRSREISEARR